VARQEPHTRANYPVFQTISTRWMDNDVYGHVNNVVYYSYFDTAVNGYLMAQGVLDYRTGDTVGLVVETGCQFFAPIAFPDTVNAGIRVRKIGTSSVRYEVGLFANDSDSAAAQGHFVHVYVSATDHRPIPLPEDFRAALQPLLKV
jgi:acyl-CoA thioester hydrolase